MTSKLKTDVLETVSGSGTIALTNQLSGMTHASVPQLTEAQMPAGSVLQTVIHHSTAAQSLTSTLWADTGLSVSLTPSSTASKVKIEFVFSSILIGSGVTAGCSFRILRGSTSLFTPAAKYAFYAAGGLGGSTYRPYMDMALDEPSTTSEVTYTVQVAGYSTSLLRINNGSSFRDTIIATEIKG